LTFYSAIGYEVVGSVPETPLGSLTMIKLPKDDFVTIELVHDPAHRHEGLGSALSHLVIQVERMNDFIAELARHGIEAEEPTSPDGSDDFWTSWIVDPDGRRIELVQWPSGHGDGMSAADFGN
jgi:lactoylglutathione lyase